MLRNVLLEKSLAILAAALIVLHVSAWAAGGDNIIKVYKADGGNYLVLEAAKGDDRFYLPLPHNLAEWLTNPKAWDFTSEAFDTHFPWKTGDVNSIKKLQSAIGAPPDGDWGGNSWVLFEIKLRALSEDNPILNAGDYRFQFASLESSSKPFPALENRFEDFWPKFEDWQNWKKAETKLKKIESTPIHIAELNADGSGSSERLQWLADIGNDPAFQRQIVAPDGRKYIKAYDLKNNQINIYRDLKVFPNKPAELQLIVAHIKYVDLKKVIPITVAPLPNEPQPSIFFDLKFWLLMIWVAGIAFLAGQWQRGRALARMIEEKNKSNLSGHLEAQPLIRDDLKELLLLAKQNNQLIKALPKAVLQNQDAKEALLQISQLLNKTLQGLELPGYKTLVSVGSKQEFDTLVENIHQGVQSLESYIGEISNRETNNREGLLSMGKKILDKVFDPNKYSRQVDREVVIKRDLLIADVEKQINNYKQNFNTLQNRFKELLRVFQPLAQNDYFRQLFSIEFWAKANPDLQQSVIQESSQTFRDMEVTFPQFFKNIESQLQRAGKICDNFLMAPIESFKNESELTHNLENDIKQLYESLHKSLLGEPNARPEWTKDVPLLPANEDIIKLQDEFWKNVWENELDRAMQLTQKILFKLKLILCNRNNGSEAFFKKVYVLEMAAGAILHILQSVVLTCGRLYHDIVPGQKVNLDFVSKEGDWNILDDQLLYREVKNSALQVGDIVDVKYWGVSELGKASIKTIKSRVVERPLRM